MSIDMTETFCWAMASATRAVMVGELVAYLPYPCMAPVVLRHPVMRRNPLVLSHAELEALAPACAHAVQAEFKHDGTVVALNIWHLVERRDLPPGGIPAHAARFEVGMGSGLVLPN